MHFLFLGRGAEREPERSPNDIREGKAETGFKVNFVPHKMWPRCADVKTALSNPGILHAAGSTCRCGARPKCLTEVLVRCFPPSFKLLQEKAKPNCMRDVSNSLTTAAKCKEIHKSNQKHTINKMGLLHEDAAAAAAAAHTTVSHTTSSHKHNTWSHTHNSVTHTQPCHTPHTHNTMSQLCTALGWLGGRCLGRVL